MRKGISLIEVIIGIAIVVVLFGGIYVAYIGILDAVQNSELRTAATTLLNQNIEVIRNLPYDSVGVVGGIPAGVLVAQEYATSTTGVRFLIGTTVRNIDDPFDGTLGGNPNDTAPADYKLVELTISCPGCIRFVPLVLTTTVAPKDLESASSGGSLFINVLDASGHGIQNASVHITNASVTPAIDLTDTTNAQGVLQLVGVPTSTLRYHMVITKEGYSTESTYPIGEPGNPNPVNPDVTVAEQSLTQVNLSIDRVSTVHVTTKNNVCQALGNTVFTLQGAKPVGTNPLVLKFSTSSTTNAEGVKSFSTIEFDTYTAAIQSGAHVVAGVQPFQPMIVNPSSTVEVDFILASSSVRSLMVTAKDAVSGAGVTGADITLSSSGGYSQMLTTGRAVLTASDWSGGNYIDQSGMDAESTPSMLTMAGAPYSTSTTAWLISPTLDLGGASSTLYEISWNPTSQPGGTTMRFQIASNNDNATWDYVGPDGTANTYYAVSGGAISAVHNGKQYFRYKVFMTTVDENVSPALSDISFEFTGPCVPPAQVLFAGMSTGAFTITADAVGYAQTTSSVTIANGWQEAGVLLSQ
jgi:type II secretory pathway pseudopilin PulG